VYSNSRTTALILIVIVLIGSGMTSTTVIADSQEIKWDHVNVALADETVYNDVTVAWKLEGYSMEITRADGVRVNISPTLIAKITDSDGVDITNEVAGLSPATDMSFALLGDEKTIPFQFKIMILAGLSGALTNADDSHKPLGAGYAGARFGFSDKIHASVIYRRQNVVESTSAAGGSFSTDAHEIHLMLGTRMTHPRRNDNYGYMEAGVILINFDQRFDNENKVWISDDTGDLGVVVQGGVAIPISENFAIDLNGILEYRPSLIIHGGESAILLGLNIALAYFN